MWFTLFCTLLRVNLFGMSFTVDLFRNAHGIVGVRMRFVLGMKVVTWFETVVDAEFQFFDSCFLFENNTIWGGGGSNKTGLNIVLGLHVSIPQVLS